MPTLHLYSYTNSTFYNLHDIGNSASYIKMSLFAQIIEMSFYFCAKEFIGYSFIVMNTKTQLWLLSDAFYFFDNCLQWTTFIVIINNNNIFAERTVVFEGPMKRCFWLEDVVTTSTSRGLRYNSIQVLDISQLVLKHRHI